MTKDKTKLFLDVVILTVTGQVTGFLFNFILSIEVFYFIIESLEKRKWMQGVWNESGARCDIS